MKMDPNLEFKAPQFVDFNHLDESAVDHEKYFGKYIYFLGYWWHSLTGIQLC